MLKNTEIIKILEKNNIKVERKFDEPDLGKITLVNIEAYLQNTDFLSIIPIAYFYWDGTDEDFVNNICEIAEKFNVTLQVKKWLNKDGENEESIYFLLDQAENIQTLLLNAKNELENLKKEYSVVITETVSETFSVKANSKEEALKKAKEKYNTEEFVLEPGEVIDVKFSIS